MSIRNILVAFNGTKPAEQAVRLAVDVARSHDAHLTGIFAQSLPCTTLQMDAYIPADIAAGMERQQREHELHVGGEFAVLSDAEGMSNRVSFFAVRGYPNDVIAQYARSYDLVVISQPDSDDTDVYQTPQADTIALISGRPVLVAPRNYEGRPLGGNALVAWDGKRAAARALSDAMDLIEEEKSVTVLHVGDENGVRQPGNDILEHLSRHAMHPRLMVQARDGMAISDIVLNSCLEADTDLLVMGAYEHSRFSEMLLGGVTRDVVRQSHIPVLLSH